jgi:hypothetical protein
MTEAEQVDLDAMKVAQAKERELAFSMFRMILNARANELKSMGYHSIEVAMRHIIERSLKKIDNLGKAHIAKYPD